MTRYFWSYVTETKRFYLSLFLHQVEKVIFATPQRLVVGTVVVNIAVAIESWGQKIKYSYSINQKK